MEQDKLVKIRAGRLFAFGISLQVQQKLVGQVSAQRLNALGATPQRLGLFQHLCQEITVGEVMEYFEKTPNRPIPQSFLNRLLEIGLRNVDWAFLPVNVERENLRALSKSQILDLPIEALRVFSVKGLRRLRLLLGKKPHEMVTVRNIISEMSLSRLSEHHYNMEISYHRARRTLQELGFGYEDGIFFQDHSWRKTIEGLIAGGMDKERAEWFARKAHQLGWRKFPLEDVPAETT